MIWTIFKCMLIFKIDRFKLKKVFLCCARKY
jgi:hypothetical protein